MLTTVRKPKFARLRDLVRDQILAGVYKDGQALPPEADLAARHRVSRVTVRKALEALKDERIVTSFRGSGTLVTLRRDAHQGALDVVVLTAPAYEPFFSAFFRHFEEAADRNGTIVVFTQESPKNPMDSADFYRRFLDKGIRDFVLWPVRGFADVELVDRLRGLGVNLVFFDHHVMTEHADCVQLDNRHAIGALVDDLRAQGCRRLDFIGWDDVLLSSTEEREAAFRAIAGPADQVWRVSKYGGCEAKLDAVFTRLRRDGELPAGFVCLNAVLGAWVCERLSAWGLTHIRVGTVDEMAPSPGVAGSCLVQPLERMADRAFQSLRDQNRLGARWKAGRYAMKGTLRRAGEAG